MAGITEGLTEIPEYKLTKGVYKHGVGAGGLQSSKWLQTANTTVNHYVPALLHYFQLGKMFLLEQGKQKDEYIIITLISYVPRPILYNILN